MLIAMGYAPAQLESRDDWPTDDQIVQLDGATWEDYERLLEIRGERAVPRITFLEGILEIMTPSQDHELIKSLIGCLVEVYCMEAGIRFTTVGSWTIKKRKEERGAEPDECYIFGDGRPDRPDLAIEVIWTSGRLDKLDVYRKLGVGEVWTWRRGRIQPHVLRGDRYELVERSEVLPGLDLELLVQFLDRPSTYDAIRDFRAALETMR
jgi:Uma2 family endonuclease